MKQKDKITGWVYEEYKKYVTENESDCFGNFDSNGLTNPIF